MTVLDTSTVSLDKLLAFLESSLNLNARFPRAYTGRPETLLMNALGSPHGSVLVAVDGGVYEFCHIDSSGDWKDGLPDGMTIAQVGDSLTIIR